MITKYRVRHRDGRYFWVANSGVPMRDRDGIVTGVVSVHRDITEQVRVEEALVESEARYRNIVEHAVEGIFQTAPDGTFISANAALAKIRAGKVQLLLEQSIFQLLSRAGGTAVSGNAASPRCGLSVTSPDRATPHEQSFRRRCQK